MWVLSESAERKLFMSTPSRDARPPIHTAGWPEDSNVSAARKNSHYTARRRGSWIWGDSPCATVSTGVGVDVTAVRYEGLIHGYLLLNALSQSRLSGPGCAAPGGRGTQKTSEM